MEAFSHEPGLLSPGVMPSGGLWRYGLYSDWSGNILLSRQRLKLRALLKKTHTHTQTRRGREAVSMKEEQKQYKAKTRVGIFSFLPARVLKS